MSAIFNIKPIKIPSEGRGYQMYIRATNNEVQQIPQNIFFYFVILADLYYYIKNNKYGYGTFVVNKDKDSIVSLFEIELFENYCSTLDDFFKKNDYSKKVLSSLTGLDTLKEYLKITITESALDENGCATALVLVTSSDEDLLLPLKGILELDVSFDENYLL